MGTTRAFYVIQNNGLSIEFLKTCLLSMQAKMYGKQKSNKHLSVGSEQGIINERGIQEMSGCISDTTNVVLAYNENSRWIALFEPTLCEGYCASDKDTRFLSNVFNSDVIAFSLFDSDVLFISYSRLSDNLSFNISKPNNDDCIEYDSDMYPSDFPDFLAPFCYETGLERLNEIWESEEYTFADERMNDICMLIGASILWNAEEIPIGFRKI